MKNEYKHSYFGDWDIWYEYLNIINFMAEGGGLLYSLDQKRTDAHKKLFEFYQKSIDGFIGNRLTDITNNLNLAIGFNPPIENFDPLSVYTNQIVDLIHCAVGKNFLAGKTYRLRTSYGIIEFENELIKTIYNN